MLKISRKRGEKIMLDHDTYVEFLGMNGTRAIFGFKSGKFSQMEILREEIYVKKHGEVKV